MVKNHFENFRNYIMFSAAVFETAMNLAPIDVLWIFGNQYIMARILSCLVILESLFCNILF